MWIAAEVGTIIVLFNSESEKSLAWLTTPHGVGKTREEAISDLKRRLYHEK